MPDAVRLTHRRTLALALPIMLANVSTPLLGLVDTAVVGRLPDPAYIGAVALGALVFSILFWAFGFLRMGTTGLAAQARGAGDAAEADAVLLRALALAAGIGVLLVLLQWPLGAAAFALLEGSARVESLTAEYFSIRIWAAPMALANYAFIGWFVGLGRTRTALGLQLVLNLANIALDALLVLVFELGVAGVALGTLIAEAIAAAAGAVVAWRSMRRARALPDLAGVWCADRLRRMIAVNRDIMVRSLALMFVFAWFTAAGARQGDLVLAANAILLNFVSAGAYVLDGLAHAAEALVGHAVGQSRRRGVRDAARITTLWAAGAATLLGAVLYLAGADFIDLMTVDDETRELARRYLPWAALAPVAGVWSFQLDGIFIGATRTAEMRTAMLLALGVYLGAWWLATPWDNHGLWAALIVSYLARAGFLILFYPRLLESVGERATSKDPSP